VPCRQRAVSCPPRGSPSSNIVEVLIDPFLAAEFGNTVLAAQALQHDVDLLLGRMVLTGGPADIPNRFLRAVRYALACLPHRGTSTGYDAPAILSYAIRPFSPTRADGLQLDKTAFVHAKSACRELQLVKVALIMRDHDHGYARLLQFWQQFVIEFASKLRILIGCPLV
jgi:hypothetical protein